MQSTKIQTDWSRPPDALNLQSAQVDVWRISLDLLAATVKRLAFTLSEGETRRAARFHFPADRQRYIVAHGCLRDILSRYLDCKPGELCLSQNQWGKPALPDHPIQFNLSHSGGFALVAVTHACKVGIDVECIRPEMDFESIARRFFSQSEFLELMAVPPDLRQSAFFDCWTRKEAYIKAHGLGLSLPLDSFDVSLSPGAPALLRATRPDPGEAAHWSLLALDVDPVYRAAVAVESSVLSLPAPGKGTQGAPLSATGSVERLPVSKSLAFQFLDWNLVV